MEGIPSFIKIGGAVSEKNDHNRQKFVVLYIGFGKVGLSGIILLLHKDTLLCRMFNAM